MTLNLHRRHLTSGQRAACGTEIEERLAAEAKERQRASGGNRGNQHTPKPRSDGNHSVLIAPVAVQEKIPEPPKPVPQARDQAAKLVGTNPRYIQDAKTVKAASPELHEKVKAGTITLPQAKREVDRAEKRAELEAKAAAVVVEPEAAPTCDVREGGCNQLPGWAGRTGAVPPASHQPNRSSSQFS